MLRHAVSLAYLQRTATSSRERVRYSRREGIVPKESFFSPTTPAAQTALRNAAAQQRCMLQAVKAEVAFPPAPANLRPPSALSHRASSTVIVFRPLIASAMPACRLVHASVCARQKVRRCRARVRQRAQRAAACAQRRAARVRYVRAAARVR